MKIIKSIVTEDFDEIAVGDEVFDMAVIDEIRFNRGWFDCYNNNAGKLFSINSRQVNLMIWAHEGKAK